MKVFPGKKNQIKRATFLFFYFRCQLECEVQGIGAVELVDPNRVFVHWKGKVGPILSKVKCFLTRCLSSLVPFFFAWFCPKYFFSCCIGSICIYFLIKMNIGSKYFPKTFSWIWIWFLCILSALLLSREPTEHNRLEGLPSPPEGGRGELNFKMAQS